MPPSIPASAIADSAVQAPGLAQSRQWLRTAAATPAGRLGAILVGITLLAATLAPVLGTTDPAALTGPSLAPPSLAFPMGTDALGRDVYSGVLYASRTSLLIASSASVLTLICGLAVGLLAGHSRGVWDEVLMRVTELVQVVPRFLLVIVAVALFGAGIEVLALTIGLTSWPALARAIRAEVLALREIDFVRAAEAMGASRMRVLRRELLPNVMPTALTMFGLSFGQVLLLEASLGFLGAADPNALSWGGLAGQGQAFLRSAWWLPFFPGLAITIAVLGTNLLADAASRAMGGR